MDERPTEPGPTFMGLSRGAYNVVAHAHVRAVSFKWLWVGLPFILFTARSRHLWCELLLLFLPGAFLAMLVLAPLTLAIRMPLKRWVATPVVGQDAWLKVWAVRGACTVGLAANWIVEIAAPMLYVRACRSLFFGSTQ